MSRDQRNDQSATSIQSLLNTNVASFLMTSHVRSALCTLKILQKFVKLLNLQINKKSWTYENVKFDLFKVDCDLLLPIS